MAVVRIQSIGSWNGITVGSKRSEGSRVYLHNIIVENSVEGLNIWASFSVGKDPHVIHVPGAWIIFPFL